MVPSREWTARDCWRLALRLLCPLGQHRTAWYGSSWLVPLLSKLSTYFQGSSEECSPLSLSVLCPCRCKGGAVHKIYMGAYVGDTWTLTPRCLQRVSKFIYTLAAIDACKKQLLVYSKSFCTPLSALSTRARAAAHFLTIHDGRYDTLYETSCLCWLARMVPPG